MAFLIVGLGNPGKEYEGTRHNAGFVVLAELARRFGADPAKEKFTARLAKARVGAEDVWLLEPQTFMNLSGDAVQPAAAFLKIAPEQIVVVHDEIDLPFADVRLKKGGGHAGQNGLRSIIARLGTPEFHRVRVGIGRPGPGFRGTVSDWVLGRFEPVDRAQFPDVVARAATMVEDLVKLGPVAATNKHHAPPARSPKAG